MLLNECMSRWHAVRGAPHVCYWGLSDCMLLSCHVRVSEWIYTL